MADADAAALLLYWALLLALLAKALPIKGAPTIGIPLKAVLDFLWSAPDILPIQLFLPASPGRYA